MVNKVVVDLEVVQLEQDLVLQEVVAVHHSLLVVPQEEAAAVKPPQTFEASAAGKMASFLAGLIFVDRRENEAR